MNVQIKNKEKGFTIIEVVLVLAIAGLIFLMVFIALPALQRGQRDTQRRDDASRFISQLQSYSTNNKAKVPASAAELVSFKTNYLKWVADGVNGASTGEYNDPKTGKAYVITFAIAPASPVDGTIYYSNNATCNGETMAAVTNQPRLAAVAIKLEGSGIFCQTNK